jgi:cysteine desulfurase
MKRIYFDNAATTKVDKRVSVAMKPYFSHIYGNASSLHSFGLDAKHALENAREVIAQKIGAKHNEIIFTSGATEADNMAIRGVAYANREKGNHIITTSIEHPAVMETCRFLETQGFRVSFLPVSKEGLIDIKKFEDELNEDTILVSVIFANNEIGSVQPIEEIGRTIRKYNEKNGASIYFHTDAVQAFTKINISVNKFNLDLLSLSAHKIYGPKGVGALYIKEGTKIEKIIYGGHHEYNMKPGTENVTGIIGLAKAVKLFGPKNYKAVRVLRNHLINKILKEIPDSYLNGSKDKKTLPNIANFTFKNVEGEALMLLLDKEGIAVSTGSACASSSLEPSYVLRAIGVPVEESHGSLRISLGKDNDREEINCMVKILKKSVKRLREMNPLK